jgi:hypothetical protein
MPNAHVVIIDSSRVRQSTYYAIYLNSPGALFHASTIDTTRMSGYPAAVLGAGASWQNSTLRGAPGIGLRTVTAPGYLGGGRIEGSGGVGLELTARPGAGAPIRITGGATYPAEFDLSGFAVLYPTIADQDSLAGNARDT